MISARALSTILERYLVMSVGKLKLYRCWMLLPIAGFLVVVKEEAWPLIAALSCPLIIARYLPVQLFPSSVPGIRLGGFMTIPGFSKWMPLFIVGVTIITVNMIPEKIEQRKCNYELAGNLDQDKVYCIKSAGQPFLRLLHHDGF